MNKIKIVFIKACKTAAGSVKRGDPGEVEPDKLQAGLDAGLFVTAREWETIQAQREAGKQSIITAVQKLKDSGAIAPKDEVVQAACLKQYEEQGIGADIVVRLLEAEHKPLATANANHTGRLTDGTDGTRGGLQVVRTSLKDALENGYIKAREPMDRLIRDGRMKEAMVLARDTGLVMAEHVMPIYTKGENFRFRDVITAADNVDNTNNPAVGTLATGLVMLTKTFGFLKNKLTFLDKITTDLRAEAVLFGQNVITRYVTPPTVATFVPGVGMTTDASTIATWKATVTAANPAGTVQTSGTQTRSTASTTDVNIVLNNYKGVTLLFNNLTLSATLRNLPGEQYDAQLYSLTEQVNKDLLTALFGATWSGVSTAAFSLCGSKAPVGPPSTNPMGLSNVIAVKNKFSMNKMPDVGRFLILNSAYHDAILADGNLLSAKAILALIKKDLGAFEDGELPVLFGVKVLESQLSAYAAGALVTITDPNQAPTTAANGVGFAGNSASAIFVARIPQDYNKILGDIPQTASLEIVTEPDSGLSLLVKKRVDHNLEQTIVDTGLMYSFAQGDPRQGFVVLP